MINWSKFTVRELRILFKSQQIEGGSNCEAIEDVLWEKELYG